MDGHRGGCQAGRAPVSPSPIRTCASAGIGATAVPTARVCVRSGGGTGNESPANPVLRGRGARLHSDSDRAARLSAQSFLRRDDSPRPAGAPSEADVVFF